MVLITNSRGETEPFNREKIFRTCMRSGVSRQVAEKISIEIEKKIYDRITTRQILKMVISALKKENTAAAARYDLRGALLRLGPSGFAFETFFAEVLFHYGYSFRTHQFIRGSSGVIYEIDIVAEKNGKKILIESKYHNATGIYTGVHEALYTWARFLDIRERTKEFSNAWLVSNTKFSSDAVQYANHVGLNLIGWKYPKDEGLHFLIESKKLYPITILPNLSQDDYNKFSEAGLLLLKDLDEQRIEKIHSLTHINFKKLNELKLLAKNILSD